MEKVFISGSIKIKELSNDFLESINNIIDKNMRILIGDAHGVDKIVQIYLHNKNYRNVEIYHVGAIPRNNIGSFTTKKINYKELESYELLPTKVKNEIEHSERKKQQFKDRAMSEDANHLLVLWDGASTGSKDNILNGLAQSKFVKIYYNGFINKENVTKEKIIEIFNENNGLKLTEVKSQLNEIIKNKHISLNTEDTTEINDIYPLSKKKIEDNLNIFKPFLIEKNYRGKVTYSYKPAIVNYVFKRIECVKNKNKKELLPFF